MNQRARISTLSPDQVRQLIEESNRRSASSRAKYVYSEQSAVAADYELAACRCLEDCWCRRNACTGHYRIKEISFETFLDTYLTLWIPRASRRRVREAVMDGRPFNGRQKNALPPLMRSRENWAEVLSDVRGYTNCGFCGTAVPRVSARVTNLYEAKMWSQLFYDSVVPFDTKSRAEIKRARYPDPANDFLAMNRELFADLRKLSEAHGLDIPTLRKLDSPGTVAIDLLSLPSGQPLSRVIDKIFYHP